MGSDLVKKLIIVILMAVLAFVVGSQAADGRLQSSIAPIAAIIGIFVFLYLGTRCWWLIFLLPALQEFLPIPSVFGLPLAQLTTACVFAYWLLMSAMGYATIKWRSLIWLDIPVFLFFLYFINSYFQHPVSISVLDEEGDIVGGKDYVYMALGLVTYCAISLIPCSLEQLCRVVKWTIWVSIALSCLSTFKRGASLGGKGIANAAANTRFGLLSGLGNVGMTCLCAWNSPFRILFSPVKILLAFVCLFGIAMGGWRETVLGFSCFLVVWAFSYRQLYVLVCAGAMALAGIYFLSSQDVLLRAPHGVQRILTPLPGLKLKKDIREGTAHSTEWRKVMWRWALDPRMGYIKDYVWGDGFGISRTNVRLNSVNIMRGRMNFGDQTFFAENGVWHSGYITTLQHLGYVGVVFSILWTLSAFGVVLRLCYRLNGTKVFPYALYATGSYVGAAVLFYISAGTYLTFFSTVTTIAIAKAFYVEAMRDGILPPLFSRQTYVPFMLREEELQRLRLARKGMVQSNVSPVDKV